MRMSRFIKLIELDGTEAPQVRDPKIVKVAPNAPILQSKDKEAVILQSEKPEEVEEIFIPYVLEGKKKQKPSITTIMGIVTIAAIMGVVAAHYEAKEREVCLSKTAEEGFECRKKLKLQEIETKIGLLRKRLQQCYTKIDKEQSHFRQHCVDSTEEKILELREKYRQLMVEKYKGPKK
jgi:hypothetical protein